MLAPGTAILGRSLARLRTDHIDLYQLHWPNRGSYHFRRYWSFDPTGRKPDAVRQDIADTLGISIGTVESRLFRARARFRDKLTTLFPDFGQES